MNKTTKKEIVQVWEYCFFTMLLLFINSLCLTNPVVQWFKDTLGFIDLIACGMIVYKYNKTYKVF